MFVIASECDVTKLVSEEFSKFQQSPLLLAHSLIVQCSNGALFECSYGALWWTKFLRCSSNCRREDTRLFCCCYWLKPSLCRHCNDVGSVIHTCIKNRNGCTVNDFLSWLSLSRTLSLYNHVNHDAVRRLAIEMLETACSLWQYCKWRASVRKWVLSWPTKA